MRLAEEWWPIERAKAADVPQVATSRAAWSVIGTLSVMDTADVPTLHRRLGPARMITKRHTQRMVRWLEEGGFTSNKIMFHLEHNSSS